MEDKLLAMVLDPQTQVGSGATSNFRSKNSPNTNMPNPLTIFPFRPNLSSTLFMFCFNSRLYSISHRKFIETIALAGRGANLDILGFVYFLYQNLRIRPLGY